MLYSKSVFAGERSQTERSLLSSTKNLGPGMSTHYLNGLYLPCFFLCFMLILFVFISSCL